MIWQRIYRTWSPLVAVYCYELCGAIACGIWIYPEGVIFFGTPAIFLGRSCSCHRHWKGFESKIFFWGGVYKTTRWFQNMFFKFQPILAERIQSYYIIFFNWVAQPPHREVLMRPVYLDWHEGAHDCHWIPSKIRPIQFQGRLFQWSAWLTGYYLRIMA